MKSKKWQTLAAAIFCCLSLGNLSYAATPIKDCTAIAKVTGDGEHVADVIVQYDQPITASSVSPDDYSVDGRTIERAYTNTTDNPSPAGTAFGSYVVLQLKDLPLTDSSVDPHPEDGSMEKRQSLGHNGPQLGSHGNPQPLPVIKATVSQTGLVKTTTGSLYGPSAPQETTKVREPIVEDFQQRVFTDETQQNATLKYNLYIPAHYDSHKKYPLVLFMHDAGTVSPEIKATLVQGLGAVTFASPEWQAKHPCFVLAPQYDTIIVDDNYQYGPELDRTIHLVQQLCRQYSIDTDRIYNTGQSMGGMTSIAMDVKYPDFFAGSYLVACKWNENITSPLGHQHIWAVTSQGDPGASPSLTKIMANLEKEGVKVAVQTLDPTQPQDQVDAQAASLITADCSHYLTQYQGGSHRSTWQHAYTMQPALEWLFAQKRTASAQ